MNTGLYRLDEFKDNCGIAADGKTGDGCGLLIQKPDSFLRAIASEGGVTLSDVYGVGSLMFSQDDNLFQAAKTAIIEEFAAQGLSAAVLPCLYQFQRSRRAVAQRQAFHCAPKNREALGE